MTAADAAAASAADAAASAAAFRAAAVAVAGDKPRGRRFRDQPGGERTDTPPAE